MNKIQTCGSSDEDGYSLSICFTNDYLITLEKLSKEDMLELKSCIDCMLTE